MFDISFSELALCFIVALVVLGPERLPKLARTLGLWSGKARAYMRNLTNELERETQMADIKKQFQEAQQALLDSKAALEKSTRALHDDVKERILPPVEAPQAVVATDVEVPPAVATTKPEPVSGDAKAAATPATRAPLPPSEQQYP
ncbi:MAG: tatB [Hydrocarboniphaga sp.]|uniref:Sec-independent protein translocase protein TatB n=1 Tax=Hydrocarboniphaga sp. TaxID=2033016 RepID=UPI002629D184|nr:Sec-independent protein translocase protein TatB [Hydrocarboniphaga sp.]MDB5969501.1 tatB [Hydrocarboniphaga sp.]